MEFESVSLDIDADAMRKIRLAVKNAPRPRWWEIWAECKCGGEIRVVVTTPSGELLGRKCNTCELPYTVRWDRLDKEAEKAVGG